MAHPQPDMGERNLCSKRKFCGNDADNFREVRYCGEWSRLRGESDMDESTPFRPGPARDSFDYSRSEIDYENDLLWVECSSSLVSSTRSGEAKATSQQQPTGSQFQHSPSPSHSNYSSPISGESIPFVQLCELSYSVQDRQTSRYQTRLSLWTAEGLHAGFDPPATVISWYSRLRLDEPDIYRLAIHLWKRISSSRRYSDSALLNSDSAAESINVLAACLWIGCKLLNNRFPALSAAAFKKALGKPLPGLCAAELEIMELLEWRPLQGFFP